MNMSWVAVTKNKSELISSLSFLITCFFNHFTSQSQPPPASPPSSTLPLRPSSQRRGSPHWQLPGYRRKTDRDLDRKVKQRPQRSLASCPAPHGLLSLLP